MFYKHIYIYEYTHVCRVDYFDDEPPLLLKPLKGTKTRISRVRRKKTKEFFYFSRPRFRAHDGEYLSVICLPGIFIRRKNFIAIREHLTGFLKIDETSSKLNIRVTIRLRVYGGDKTYIYLYIYTRRVKMLNPLPYWVTALRLLIARGKNTFL